MSQNAFGATYYVAPYGSDSNQGTAVEPFRTLQQGVNAALAGDTVIVRDGTYGPENAITGGDQAYNIASPVWLYNSGTPSAWITIMAENKGSAILDCNAICDAYINLYNASYIVIQDFVIRNGYREGIHSNDAAHHITLRGNRIEYIGNRPSSSPQGGGSGMYTNPNCHDFIIDGNVFHDVGRTSGSTSLDHGLYLHGSNFTITNNVFYDIPSGWAIQMADGFNNALIANNTFAFANTNQPGQIMMWNTNWSITIRNNIFYGPRDYAVVQYDSNIADCTIDHNLVDGASGVTAPSNPCHTEANDVGADPMFTDPANADFHLQANSPAIGVGIPVPSILNDLDGNARALNPSVDIGAYKYTPPGWVQLVNSSSQGSPAFNVGDVWTITIGGGLPYAPVRVRVGNWTALMGTTDASGAFALSGVAPAESRGFTYNEVWSVGGVTANPSPVVVAVLP